VTENLPSRRITVDDSIPTDIELIIIEISTKSSKWIIIATYKPPSQNKVQDKARFLNAIQHTIDKLSSKYSNFLVIGDLNMENDNLLNEFIETYGLVNMIKNQLVLNLWKTLHRLTLYLQTEKNVF